MICAILLFQNQTLCYPELSGRLRRNRERREARLFSSAMSFLANIAPLKLALAAKTPLQDLNSLKRRKTELGLSFKNTT
jgi:hypothetical protein